MTRIQIFLVGLCLLATCQVKAYYMEMKKDPKEILNYIENLEIAPQIVKLDPGTDAAVVDCEAIVVDPMVPPQAQVDMEYALLFGLLAAKKKYPDPKNATDFFSTVSTVLQNIGVFMNCFSWTNIDTSAEGFTVGNQLVTFLTSTLDAPDLSLVSGLLSALEAQQESGSDVWKVFSSESKTATDARFGIGAVTANGTTTYLTFAASSMHASELSETFLWSTWESTPLTLQLAACQVVLNENLYVFIRQAIIIKLGNAATTYIQNFDT